MGARLLQACRRARGASPPRRSSTIPTIRSATASCTEPAKDLAPELRARIVKTAKRIYRTLELDGYARIDFRLSADNVPYFLEANPNPEIARSQEFAHAAEHDGIGYPDLLSRIVTLGISRARATGLAY